MPWLWASLQRIAIKNPLAAALVEVFHFHHAHVDLAPSQTIPEQSLSTFTDCVTALFKEPLARYTIAIATPRHGYRITTKKKRKRWIV